MGVCMWKCVWAKKIYAIFHQRTCKYVVSEISSFTGKFVTSIQYIPYIPCRWQTNWTELHHHHHSTAVVAAATASSINVFNLFSICLLAHPQSHIYTHAVNMHTHTHIQQDNRAKSLKSVNLGFRKSIWMCDYNNR